MTSSREANAKQVLELKLKEKDILIADLNETVDILQLKIEKLEQLLVLKDRRIADLMGKDQ